MDKETAFVSLVFYLYNDEENIREFLNTMCFYASERFEYYEVICVDDGSVDRTIENVKKSITEGKSITLVEMGIHQGLELAMNAGVDISIGDFVYEFDSTDLIYDLKVVDDVFSLCKNGKDIVSACPVGYSSLGSNIFYYLYNLLSSTQYTLKTDSFRVLSRRAINRTRSMSRVLPYRKAVYANCGLIMFNYDFTPVKKIIHKQDNGYRLSLAIDTFVLYTNIAYKLTAFFSMFMFVLTVGISLYAVAIRIQGIPVAGWTSMVLVICASFFGMSFLLSLVTKYTELILHTVFTKQKYLIKSVDRIS